MRLKITADDSYSTTMICNDTITSNELIEEFIKLRKLESPLSQHHLIESKSCMLAYYVTKATLQHITKDTIIDHIINKKFAGIAEFKLFGYKNKHADNAIQQLYALSSQFSTISSIFNRSLDEICRANRDVDLNQLQQKKTLKSNQNNNNVLKYVKDETNQYFSSINLKLTNSILECKEHDQSYHNLIKAKGLSYLCY